MKHLRFVTSGSLFDGHDVSINIIRRILQSKGVEVIHLGHNRSALEVAQSAIQEDVHGVAISSYQGGHNEYFAYVRKLLNEKGAGNIRIFGGGGGVITAGEIESLHKKGITKIYSPEDGQKMGLVGIIEDMIHKSAHLTWDSSSVKENYQRKNLSDLELAHLITAVEDGESIEIKPSDTPILGITGTGGSGKSSLIDELLIRVHRYFPDKKIALLSIDPTKKKAEGALLGDRIRLSSISLEKFYIRSLATRDSGTELSPQINNVVDMLKSKGFDLIIVETSGIGQSSHNVTKLGGKCIYVMTPEYGAPSQLEKIEMISQADIVVLNKCEKPQAEDAYRDVIKQFCREREIFENTTNVPVFGTIASEFNNTGINALFEHVIESLHWEKTKLNQLEKKKFTSFKQKIIPPDRVLYLREIAKVCRDYNRETILLKRKLKDYESILHSSKILPENNDLKIKLAEIEEEIPSTVFSEVDAFKKTVECYKKGTFEYKVRNKTLTIKTKFKTLSGQEVSQIAYPNFEALSDTYAFIRNHNLPGFFPYCGGVYPIQRKDEDVKRMFAGEGGPCRTNKRFHYLSENDDAKRLSTAFDSVTLYGEDPNERLDIWGKIGESGVSVATLDDMEDLYKGFDLTDSKTSVSMTINGPAPIILALYMNAAIKQKLKGDDYWTHEKRIEIMRDLRGTVQADILKEDQAQNTCIFSLGFSLKMMGDVQEYFCKNAIKNYYSVSISGYHIAEAGANPITQLAFTLANGFTYVEYYLSRGMKIDDFASNFSFFFSNGLDLEYTVIGRVARKIWSIAMKYKYGASEKSQKFKYHIQTSGRSLHAQEVDFNDIRTTLQAFLAFCDNCNSLHTNAYDEAVTTPTEESVRRAMAIQLIINKEFGFNKVSNPLQGSFVVDELAELVEEAVLSEFDRISDKGGVLGAMESQYQRSKIQEESLDYEMRKDSGELPIVGVNTYVGENTDSKIKVKELSRCTSKEKNEEIKRLQKFQNRNVKKSNEALKKLEEVILQGDNIFEELLNTVNFCSLGEISKLLYRVGGSYRRNL